MSLNKKDFSTYIKQFNFRELFNDMGWNNDKTTQPIVVDNETYTLQAVAEKSGFKILLCNPLSNGLIPDYNTRKKIETKVTKLFQEHLIIFFDTKKTEQIWQLVVRQSGKPTKVTETRWHINQDPELLYQRAAGIFFEIDEEEHITIIDVTKRIADNFHQNNERITKQFYDKFKKEHGAFLQFIKGISDKTNQEWYASLMLNRLMFCYFIQKKGFLDNNKNYLRDKLNACLRLRSDSVSKTQLAELPAERSRSQFYSFYRDFLLVLFHKGLNEPAENRRKLSGVETEAEIEIGKIPYLNGGLFDEHELEKSNDSIDIDDKAFERLFDFFDQYEWHLDTRYTASGKDINPDVIGYIFEKYINDRANMGAYYTKEDITDYISKNCILPYLFDETFRTLRQAQGAKAGLSEAEVWQMVKQSGDQYIYDAVKKGVHETLPPEIEQGISNVALRMHWNKPAPAEYALPTEIWREVVDRRNRYTDVKNKIDKGDILHINDFITYNLNIRQFAQDVVENTNDPELLKHFYKALNSVTIIDPTCGSGAFLFAAMNILEPLYEACLQRMEIFVEECKDENNFKHLPADIQKSWKSIQSEKSWFRQVLAQVKSPEHHNLQYFIYKSIILRNLYGVDIMKEAVEIAKLRLFLKLVATVEADYRKPNLGLEPLPDIDFNIRAGNTLIGFGTEAELDKSFVGVMDFDNSKEKLEEKCDIVARAFDRYKTIQLNGETGNYAEFKAAKDDLNKRLKELNHELNQLLHKQASGLKYETWLQSHQPFHWFAEFYEIIQENKGFDVIIGNPPYVEYSKIRRIYSIQNYETEVCGNIYANVSERCLSITKTNGYFGLIIPLSFVATERMKNLRNLLVNKKSIIWLSNFDVYPSKLFEGAKQRLTIFIRTSNTHSAVFSTKYYRWKGEEREALFQSISYYTSLNSERFLSIPKIGCKIENQIFQKVIIKKSEIYLNKDISPSFYVHRIPYNFVKCFNFIPYFWNEKDGEKKSEDYKPYFLHDKTKVGLIMSIINSNLFFWWWYSMYEGYHCGKHEICSFPSRTDCISPSIASRLNQLTKELLCDLQQTSFRKKANYKSTGNVAYEEFYPRLSKPIIDEIDRVLAKHYGFTDEELDFIINYDIKYRMGKELESENEE